MARRMYVRMGSIAVSTLALLIAGGAHWKVGP
jgi:hypothetical protein